MGTLARLIFISPYLKGKAEKASLSRRTEYIATREGVELLKNGQVGKPPTKKQREYIQRLLDSFPQARELEEFKDYAAAPTMEAASEFIDEAWEQFVAVAEDRENYLDYVAHRPGVKMEGEHGLWNENGKVQDLPKAVREVSEHEGNVWTPVVSLRREDAERLGYTNTEEWRELVCSCLPEIAKGYKIQPAHLRWYAALHEKEKHVHIHMIIFSTNPREGYLSKQGIRDIKSAFARQIFAQDLIHVYEQKNEYRNEVQRTAEERMSELMAQIGSGTLCNERLAHLTEELARRLEHTKGRKVYGYLPPQVKSIVDGIVEELARDERIAAAYSLWQDLRDEVCRTYSDNLPKRLPLSRQKEFKTVRNMVIREVLKTSLPTFSFEDEDMDDEPEWPGDSKGNPSSSHAEPSVPKGKQFLYEQAMFYRKAKETLYSESSNDEDRRSALAMLENLWQEGYAIAAHQLGKAYRDGAGADRDLEKAAYWFRLCAEKDYDCAAYALGKLLLETEKSERGIAWLTKAADQGNRFAQYALGKLYLQGDEAPKNIPLAVHYLTLAAEQGNPYAQFFLDHLDDMRSPRIGLAILRIFRNMEQIFRDSTSADVIQRGIQIDRKRWMQLQEKRIALGHRPDDHEEELQQTI